MSEQRFGTVEEVAAAPEQAGAFRRLLGDARFRKLWVAQLVSGIGDWLVIGLLMPLVTTLSGGSAFAVAGILIAKIIPALLFSTVVGVLVDRFDRRKVMIAADLTRSVLALVLLFTNSLWVIYAVVLVMETASLFFYPARNALIPRLVSEQDVTAANGLAYTTQQGSMLIGLTAAGSILAGFEAGVRWLLHARLPIVSAFVGPFAPALLGPRAGVFLDTLTFLFSAAVIFSIKVEARAAQGGFGFDISLIGRDVVESFRFLHAHRELRGLLFTIGLAILGGGAIIPVGLVYIQSLVGAVPFADRITWLRQLAAAPQTFVLVCMAFGMVAGALIVPRLERAMKLQLLFAGSVAAFGVAMVGFASIQRYWVAGVFAAFAGMCIATVTVAGNSYVVQTVADEIRGRVFTALESVIKIALLLSMIVIAPLGDLVGMVARRLLQDSHLAPRSVVLTGPRLTLMVAALIVIVAAVYAFTVLRWQQLEPAAGLAGDSEEGRGSDV